jgi:prepilin-type N-terminal cleavage/methylation domain-containing protein
MTNILNKKGFTLVELLVVIAIIGILMATVTLSMKDARVQARDAQRKQAVSQIMKALEMYYLDHGEYPLSAGADSPTAEWSNSGDSSWDALKTTLSEYIGLPTDPLNDATFSGDGYYNYSYYSRGHGCNQQWYMLVYKLENSDVTSPGVTACDGVFFDYGEITIGACPGCVN